MSSLPRLVVILAALSCAPAVFGQARGNPTGPPDELPLPPSPPREQREDWPGRDEEAEKAKADEERRRREAERSFLPESDAPWGLPAAMLAQLAEVAERYRARARGFSATETAVSVKYNDGQEAGDEDVRRYAYLLQTAPGSPDIGELRNALNERGEPGRPADDRELFPPAYAWVFLFSRFHEPYFQFRDLGESLDGFDLVRTVQFRGSLPFTDGKDIRQWEGLIILDAVELIPIEILAQPSDQDTRLKALYEVWARSFNLIGYRTGPRPFGYRCQVEFRLRLESLSYPTYLRYESFRAIGRDQRVRWSASMRNYDGYKLFGVETREQVEPATAP